MFKTHKWWYHALHRIIEKYSYWTAFVYPWNNSKWSKSKNAIHLFLSFLNFLLHKLYKDLEWCNAQLLTGILEESKIILFIKSCFQKCLRNQHYSCFCFTHAIMKKVIMQPVFGLLIYYTYSEDKTWLSSK